MSKKLLSYIAALSFLILSIFRIINIFSVGLNLSYIALTAAFFVFCFYNYNDEYKSRGLYLGSTIYLLSNIMNIFKPKVITEYISIMAAILTYLIFKKLYDNDRTFLHKYWFLPALLMLISFLPYDIFSYTKIDLIKYLEPVGLFFMCLDVKEWY